MSGLRNKSLGAAGATCSLRIRRKGWKFRGAWNQVLSAATNGAKNGGLGGTSESSFGLPLAGTRYELYISF
jgi:hypothetical protein